MSDETVKPGDDGTPYTPTETGGGGGRRGEEGGGMSTDHSPLPWGCYTPNPTAANNPGEATFLVGPRSVVMDRSVGFSKEDAEFIVRAVNAHDDLLAACKALVGAFPLGVEDDPNDTRAGWTEKFKTIYRNAVAAVAKATPAPEPAGEEGGRTT